MSQLEREDGFAQGVATGAVTMAILSGLFHGVPQPTISRAS